MAHIGIYLTDSKNQTFELPVNPEELKINHETNDSTEEVVKLGAINRIGEEKLQSITIEAILPINNNTSYVTASNPLSTAQDYIDRLINIHQSKSPVRFVLSGSKISIQMTITSFIYGFKNGNSDEYSYALVLTEYKTYKAELMKIAAVKKNNRPAPPKKIGRGSTVIVNGRLHLDSYGRGPGQTERNATRKVNFIQLGRAYPYHVTLLNGGWRGWVTASSVRAV